MYELDPCVIARRDFVKVVGLGVFGLFLPRWTRHAWKQKQSIISIPWDYELSLLDGRGKEVSGRGYERVRGRGSDFSAPIKKDTEFGEAVLTESTNMFRFPQARGDWGEIDSLSMLDKKGHTIWTTIFPSPSTVPTGIIVQFNPGDIQICMN